MRKNTQSSSESFAPAACARPVCEEMEIRQFLSVSVQVADSASVTAQVPTTSTDQVETTVPAFVAAGLATTPAQTATFNPVEFMGPLVTRDPTAFDSTGVLVDTSNTLIGPGSIGGAPGVNGSAASFVGSGLGIGAIPGSPGIDRSIALNDLANGGVGVGLGAGASTTAGDNGSLGFGTDTGIGNDLLSPTDIGLGAEISTTDNSDLVDLGSTDPTIPTGTSTLFGGSSTLSGGSDTLFGGSTSSNAGVLTGTSASASAGTFSNSPVSSNFSTFGSFGTTTLFG